jgi:tripartite-type tricarboxylate transporter receptor subunit TctC
LASAGKVKVYAVTTQSRFFNLADVPALKEEGFEAMNFANFFGIVAPVGVSSAILQRLATDVNAVAQAAETRAALRKLGVDAYPSMTTQEFQKFLESERTRWGIVIRSAGLKPE